VNRGWIPWAVAGLVVSALFWIDPLFIPLALLGPIVVGAVGGWRGVELRLVALMWAVAGIGAVVSDYVVNQEDVVFHLVLTVVTVALAAASWWVARALARRRAAPAVQ
jgi:hypothetical protein